VPDLFQVQRAPFLSRQSYLHEMRHILAWGMVAGLVEGNFAAVAVAKVFDGGPLLINIAATTPVAAHLANLFWGMLCVGRSKIRVMTVCTAGVVLCLGAIGLVPATGAGAWIFVAQMAAAQFFMTGTVTTRAALWKANYPQWARGRLAARLQIARTLTHLGTLGIAAGVLDRDPESYRWVYPVVALAGVVGIRCLQRIRVRGESRQVPSEGAEHVRLTETVNLWSVLAPWRVIGGGVRVLRGDSLFRDYCVAQMLAGFANLLIRSVVVVVIAEHLLDEMWYAIWMSAVLLDILPKVVMVMVMGRAAGYFDRVGVLRYRVLHGTLWVVALLFGALGAWATDRVATLGPSMIIVAVCLFAAFAIMRGVCFGAGAIAWNLGHLHFAHPDDAEVYMGVHVSLTGLRGLTMPTAGMILWHGVGSWSGIGLWVWVISLGFALLALRAFLRLARAETVRSASAGANSHQAAVARPS
jgi:hypothetical protein